VSTGSVRMTLASERDLRAGEDIGISMTLADTNTGAPIHDLQRYLGSWAHLAIISQDTQDFLHVHPAEDSPPAPGSPSPAMIRTSVGFRRPGIYKMWVQIQRANHVLTMPFVLRVLPEFRAITGAPQAPSDATLITVSSTGYEPSRIPAKAGRPLKLAFYRVDAQNCGRVVKFPGLGIERELPPGQVVVINVTPRKSGPLSFSCGMNMMKGELLVQ
jgi:Cupredoxin-like domain